MTEPSGGGYRISRDICTADIEDQRGQRQHEDNEEVHVVASGFFVGRAAEGRKAG